jgi:hypothetical protein
VPYSNTYVVVSNLIVFNVRTKWRHAVAVAGSIPDEVIRLFNLLNPSGPHYGPEVDSASNRNKYQKIFLESKARPMRKADKINHHLWADYVDNVGASTSHRNSFTFTLLA